MMRWDGFGRSLLFAAVAAAGFLPFAIAVAPLLGWSASLAAYAWLAVAVHLAGIGATRRQGLAAAGATLVGGAVIASLAPGPRDAILAAALVLGLCRSGLLYRARFARSVAWEAILLGTGLALAGSVLCGTTFSAVLAVWAFFLVQSVFFAVGGVRERREARVDLDPFEVARDRTRALIDFDLEPR